QFFVVRPWVREVSSTLPSCSVLVPARNERGNIAALLNRLPVMGSFTEIVFIEGHSEDGTWEEIQQQIKSHPRASLFQFKSLKQSGMGKADAVRLGLSEATGDTVMILDADLTVEPEDLPHFYSALTSGAGEFINGSRLVYRMEKSAMQVLNLFFNKL